MVEININGKKFSIDGYLKSNLDILKKAVKNDWDGIILIDGMEGSGKTNMGVTTGYYLADGNFSVKNIVYTPEQFEKAVDESSKGEAILWDEFVLGGMSTDALTQMQKTLIKKFTLMRKKNLYVILIIPYIFLLRPYFAVARTRFLLHTYSSDGISRGRFKFFDYPTKAYIYFTGKKKWYYPKESKPAFVGKFGNYMDDLIDKEEYEQKKDKAFQVLNAKEDKFRFNFAKAIYYIYKTNKAFTYGRIGKVFGYSERGINHLCKDYESATDEDEIYKLLEM